MGLSLHHIEDSGECHLLSSEFSYLIQVVLLFSASLLLLYKRSREIHPREWNVWILDISKQGVSGILVHFVAILLAEQFSSAATNGNECSWYFIIFSIDVMLGTILSYLMLRLVERVAVFCQCSSLEHTGEYGTPINYATWAKQMITWSGICIVARLTCALFVFSFFQLISKIAKTVALPFDGHPKEFLIFVMLVCPVGLNLTQIWIQDTFLKQQDSIETNYANLQETGLGVELHPVEDEIESPEDNAIEI